MTSGEPAIDHLVTELLKSATELLDPHSLIDAAVDLVVAGHESSAVLEIASLPPSVSLEDARDVAMSAAASLGIDLTDVNAVRERLAREWMREVLAGRMDPYAMARSIWKHVLLRLPDDQADPYRIFVYYVEEWQEHPEDRARITRDIETLSRRLISDENDAIAER